MFQVRRPTAASLFEASFLVVWLPLGVRCFRLVLAGPSSELAYAEPGNWRSDTRTASTVATPLVFGVPSFLVLAVAFTRGH